MAPVPFPINVLGDYNGAHPSQHPSSQRAPTKHAIDKLRWNSSRLTPQDGQTGTIPPQLPLLAQSNLTPLHQQQKRCGQRTDSEQAPERASCPPAATMAAPQVGQKSAKARQSEQGDVKEEGIGLFGHARRLNVRLPLWRACSVEWFRRLVKRRNTRAPPPAHGTEGG